MKGQANRSTRIAAAYLLLQASSLPVFWLLLARHPPTRSWFFPEGEIPALFFAFVLPDLAVVGVGSLSAAAFLVRGSRLSGPALWLLFGALCYASLYTVAWVALAGGPSLAAVLMGAATVGTGWVLAQSVSRR